LATPVARNARAVASRCERGFTTRGVFRISDSRTVNSYGRARTSLFVVFVTRHSSNGGGGGGGGGGNGLR
jgi:hypothetical protein